MFAGFICSILLHFSQLVNFAIFESNMFLCVRSTHNKTCTVQNYQKYIEEIYILLTIKSLICRLIVTFISSSLVLIFFPRLNFGTSIIWTCYFPCIQGFICYWAHMSNSQTILVPTKLHMRPVLWLDIRTRSISIWIFMTWEKLKLPEYCIIINIALVEQYKLLEDKMKCVQLNHIFCVII